MILNYLCLGYIIIGIQIIIRITIFKQESLCQIGEDFLETIGGLIGIGLMAIIWPIVTIKFIIEIINLIQSKIRGA